MDSRLFDSINAAVKLAVKNDGDLTTKNLRYVYSVAMDISSKTGIDVDELFAEGVIAMKKCEQKYDPSKNNNFVKSCISSVRGYMMNYVNRMNNLVHIPVNHLKGFKSGQDERTDVSQISYSHIDGMDYDSLGTTDDTIFHRDKFEILMDGINRLDSVAKVAVKIKLKLDEYSDIKKNNMKAIADELDVPVNVASKIYKDAIKKLKKYCKAEMCND